MYEKQLRETEKAIENAVNAILGGIVSKSLQQKLAQLEVTKEELLIRIEEEKLEKPKIPADFVRFWLLRFRKLDVTKESHRQMLIDTFVNAVFVHDDKLLLTFNFKDGTRTITLTDAKIATNTANARSAANNSCSPAHIKPGDQMLDSIWADTASLPHFPALYGDTKTDVLIIGAGLAGLMTAYMMKRSGIDCLVIEADRICSGISRNTTAKITSQHGLIYHKLLQKANPDTAQKYWQAHQSALDQLRRLCDHIPCDFEEKDSYIYSAGRPDKLEQELHALSALNIPCEFVKDLPLPFSVAGAVKFSHQAQFHPLKFAAGIARGLNIYEHTAAQEINKHSVQTNRGTITAEHIVVTTHFPILNKHGSYFLKLYQDRSYVLALEHVPDLVGMYLDDAQGGLSLRNYGSFLLLGGGSHRTGKPSPGWKPLEEAAEKYYPNAKKCFYWAAQDCMTLDGMAYIGQYSKHTPHLYVATGFNKWGMTSSMLSAMILCDMVQGRENPYTALFCPSRSMMHPQLVTNVWDSAANLLTLSTPRCPHMGCALKWNPAEHSWDCPCHGSRFTKGGTLLDNPATRNMKQKP